MVPIVPSACVKGLVRIRHEVKGLNVIKGVKGLKGLKRLKGLIS